MFLPYKSTHPFIIILPISAGASSGVLNHIDFANKEFPIGKRNIEIEYEAGWGITPDDDITNGAYIPSIIKMTVLRIAALLQTESDSNIGVTSKSFADSGTRTFINTVDYSRYLIQLSNYKLIVI
jgi:hypothetical protein